MSFNVNDFRSSFGRTFGEPASTAAFEIFISNSPVIGLLDTAESLRYRCESTTTPSKRFATVERRTYGTYRNIPYKAEYEPMSVSILVSQSMKELEFFKAWQATIQASEKTGDVNYYDDIVGTVKVICYSKEGDPIYEIELVEAFPIDVSGGNLAWSNQNEAFRFNVSFQYRYWTAKRYPRSFERGNIAPGSIPASIPGVNDRSPNTEFPITPVDITDEVTLSRIVNSVTGFINSFI